MTLKKSPKTGKFSAVIETEHGPRSISTGSTNRKVAASIVKAAGVEKLEQTAKIQRLTSQTVQQIVAGKKVTVADAVKEWIIWMENYGQSARTVDNASVLFDSWVRAANLSQRLPSQVTERMVDDWVNAPDEVGVGTRKVRLATVRSFYKFCCAKAYALGNPANMVRIRMNQLTHAQKEPRVVSAFSSGEIDSLIAATSGFWRVAISIGRWTGLRLGDICQLEWDCLETPNRLIVWTDKRNRRVSLPLTLVEFQSDMKAVRCRISKEAIAHFKKLELDFTPMLRSLIRAHPLYLFPDQQEIATQPKRRALLSVQFGRICRETGIAGKSFHSMRRFYVSELDRCGVPITHIARSVGHRYEQTTRGYIKSNL